ncbi:DUF4177 domain-containing protein [Senegalia massiliensis]|uniref:DUF4177 domain-containing protein n=1 Tax=Senegalia massiliensis TaxID=1720316 RepID=A0A845R152_9CLOT|nr:DUF4177 domain-containing protein [Senegalia massiliensis]NBI08301.1 DUF4177 domain-containing protein [Senegalia massiliensis]
MYEYKVFKWNLSTLTLTEELEDILNDYGKEGWRISNIISNIKGSANVLFSSVDGNQATIILERINKD